ncbi:MAG: phage GP46 family protein [Sulfuriferula sp.]
MLKLVQTQNGLFDLAVDDLTQQSDVSAVESLIYAVLFVDAEAPPARVADRYERRGWWANPSAGSGLWHVRRQPLGSAARRETLAMISAALVKCGLQSVQVTELAGSAGHVSRVSLQMSGLHNGRQFLVKVPL